MKLGFVKSYPSIVTQNGRITCTEFEKTKSFILINQGTNDVYLYESTETTILKPDTSIIFGGYDGFYRLDDFPFKFVGAGTNLLKIIKDKVEELPS